MIYALSVVIAPIFLEWLVGRLEQWCEVKDAIEQREMLERMKR